MSSNFVFKTNPSQNDTLENYFRENNWEIDQVQYTNWRARKDKTTCTSYCSGKLMVQGRGGEELVNKVIVPLVDPTAVESKAKKKAAEPVNPFADGEFIPHIGIDESGKGDYFGPLVTAAAYVAEEDVMPLMKLGVQDSKAIKSDDKMRSMAREIKRILKDKYSVITMGNEAYNRLYDKMQNLNRMLAWAHATVLENTLEKVPDCKMAISDQFAKSERTVLSALKERGQQIKLIQMTKAESDIAVAAASILARAEFVTRMEKMSMKLGLAYNLPKGASPKVKEIATKLYKEKGFDFLRDHVKLHFKTTVDIVQNN